MDQAESTERDLKDLVMSFKPKSLFDDNLYFGGKVCKWTKRFGPDGAVHFEEQNENGCSHEFTPKTKAAYIKLARRLATDARHITTSH
jgi:hypothetical protein